MNQANAKKIHKNVHKHAKPVWYSIREKYALFKYIYTVKQGRHKSELHGERK